MAAAESVPFRGRLNTSEFGVAVLSDRECDMDYPQCEPSVAPYCMFPHLDTSTVLICCRWLVRLVKSLLDRISDGP
jgi:hypothetical protein